MVDPNNTRVGYTPSDDGEFVADDRIVRPAHGSNRPTRDFKKVFAKGGRESKDDEENASAGVKKPPARSFAEELETGELGNIASGSSADKDDQENASAGVSSVFDLSAKSSKDNVKQAPSRSDSPADLFKNMAAPKKEESPAGSAFAQAKEEKFTTSRYTQEQPDIAFINPLATQKLDAPTTSISSSVPAVVRKDLANLVDQITAMIKTLYTVEKAGQTDTVMVLDHPPLVKGAQVVISSFDSARGQLNISFEGLTAAAQKILGDEVNRQGLITSLHEKGYGVQILTVTTAIEHRLTVDQSAFRERDQRGEEQQHQREQEKEKG